MFNEYEVFQTMKFRQEETERMAKEAWKLYIDSPQENDPKTITLPSTVNPCYQCACV
jgi:hypothetical protein